MHIHLPKALHNWHEIAKEIAIIVVGVLIALTAEQLVESWHWHLKVEAAIRDMSDELSDDDGVEAYVQQTISACADRRLDAIRDAIEAGDRPRARQLIDTFWLPTRSYDNQALDAAIGAGVPGRLPTDRMHLYRTAYSVAPVLSRMGERVDQDLARLRAVPRNGGAISEADRYDMVVTVESLRMDNQRLSAGGRVVLRAMQSLGLGLHKYPLGLQMEPARHFYGNCLKPPSAEDLQRR